MLAVARNTRTDQALPRAREYEKAGYFVDDDETSTQWFMSSARSPRTKVPNVQINFWHIVLTSAADVRERNTYEKLRRLIYLYF